MSSAASQQDGSFLRDFLFHSAAYGSNGVVVAGDNNSNFARRNDLLSLNHYTITDRGIVVGDTVEGVTGRLGWSALRTEHAAHPDVPAASALAR